MHVSVLQKVPWVLIETLWNVKIFDKTFIEDSYAVLIETLWNVKMEFKKVEQLDDSVLIETLWNVKERSSDRQNYFYLY